MITIIAGSRRGVSRNDLTQALSNCGFTPTKVICGCATGADTLGKFWALENNIPIDYYPAEWAVHGRSAGFIRNAEMAKVAEALIALWDGESPGTKNMIKLAKDAGLRVHIHLLGKNENKAFG